MMKLLLGICALGFVLIVLSFIAMALAARWKHGKDMEHLSPYDPKWGKMKD